MSYSPMGHLYMTTDSKAAQTVHTAMRAIDLDQVQKALQEILDGIDKAPATFLRFCKVEVKGVYHFTPAMIATLSNALHEKTGLRITQGLDGRREIYLAIPEALKAQIKEAFERSYTGDIQNINTSNTGI